MSFTEDDKLKALAIVNIFETSRPLGDYAACVVLDDGAGISYGISQFTHRSGSLAAVVEAYLSSGGQIGREILSAALPDLRRKSAAVINKLARDERLKRALRAAAVTREMKDAQRQVAFDKYLLPALEICEAKGFILPLSLAVVYDSINHGSWERISRNISGNARRNAGILPASGKAEDSQAGSLRSDDSLRSDEKVWIMSYVRKRHLWLSSSARLKATAYRTKFFLDQIAIGNWELRLPMTVHGFRLTEVAGDAETLGRSDAGKSVMESAGEVISSAAAKFDRVDNAVTSVVTRTDRAKSLWTTVVGTVSQAVWAVFGLLVGLPREVWIVVAVIAAVLMLAYLYRQLELGRIRENKTMLGGDLTTDHRPLNTAI